MTDEGDKPTRTVGKDHPLRRDGWKTTIASTFNDPLRVDGCENFLENLFGKFLPLKGRSGKLKFKIRLE